MLTSPRPAQMPVDGGAEERLPGSDSGGTKTRHENLLTHSPSLASFHKQAGLDSIGSIELQNRLQTQFSAQLPSTLSFDYPTLSSLTDFLESLGSADKEVAVERPALEAPPESQHAVVLAMASFELSGCRGPQTETARCAARGWHSHGLPALTSVDGASFRHVC